MRTEAQVYDTVLGFAREDERIRVVTLEGSRTNVNIPPDDFQDYDITFFVTDMGSFTADDGWLDIFGERLILQKPEDMELFPAEEKVLLDKDGTAGQRPAPTDVDYHLRRPTERMFDDCCNEFWNTVPYVVKGLCRREILFAIDHLSDVVRKELLRMLSWKIGIERGFDFSLGKNYKFMEKYLPAELWERLMSTYRMGSYGEMWEALEQCMALFREVSAETAARLGCRYPDYDEKISGYVSRQRARHV